MNEKWLMIANPNAATQETGATWETYKKQLTDGGAEVDAALTAHKGHAIELAREGAEKGYRKMIAVGGDGTVHEVMTGLLRYADATPGADLGEFTLAVIPAGTGNDWIKTAGIPEDVTEATACILRGDTGKEDIVRLTLDTGVFCLANIGGVALDANICYNTNALKDKGYKGSILYSLVAPYSIFSKKLRPVEIVCDGEMVYRGKLFTAVLGNGIYRGGGLQQNEAGGNWTDGLVEVSIQPGCNHFKGMSQMMHIFKGDFATLPGIISRRFRKMTITPLGDGKRDWVEADGEIPGTLPLTVEVTGQQINIIIP